MIFPSSPHLGIIIISVGSTISIALFYLAYILYRHQLKNQPLVQEQRETRAKHRQIYADRVTIPKLLLQLHEYVITEVSKQQIPSEIAIPLRSKLLKATDRSSLFFIVISYFLPRPLKNISVKFSILSMPIIIRNWNVVFSKYDLGTLVIAQLDSYKVLYQQITDSKLVLPPNTVKKIDRCIMVSELFSSVVLWDSLYKLPQMPKNLKWKWYANFMHGKYYASRVTHKDGKKCVEFMHRLLLNTPNGMQTDHKNDNGLDNRRSNIRVCTCMENQRNQKLQTRLKSSKYKGVHWSIKSQKWSSVITVNRVKVYLGFFDSEHNAAVAYDLAALKYFGEFANLNFKGEGK